LTKAWREARLPLEKPLMPATLREEDVIEVLRE